MLKHRQIPARTSCQASLLGKYFSRSDTPRYRSFRREQRFGISQGVKAKMMTTGALTVSKHYSSEFPGGLLRRAHP